MLEKPAFGRLFFLSMGIIYLPASLLYKTNNLQCMPEAQRGGINRVSFTL
jgi:hypothetical protein